MNKPFIEIDADNFIIMPFETKPIEGYELPINRETGEQFPNCCSFHKEVLGETEKWFNRFPNCCEPHKKFINKQWFSKLNYNDIVEKIAKQISYTEYHISKKVNNPDWYKDITDYIEYNVSSFGYPAIGLHLYLGGLRHYIQNARIEIPEEKRRKLVEFAESYYQPCEVPEADLDTLLETYQKWLKEFPFELNSYFGNLKQYFERQIPILKGEPEINIYSGIAKAKVHTKSSLIEALIDLTDNLLTQINVVTLYEKGLITDVNKIKLELVINSRKLKLKQGYKNSSPNEEQRYRKILKEWFKDEKKFIDEIISLISNESDLDFIKGQFTLCFVPKGDSGHYEVKKNNYKRKFTLENYYDLYLRNWEICIDALNAKNEKIQAVNNAIFSLKKNLYSNTHPAILKLINKTLKHLKAIKEYINVSYPETNAPQQTETETGQETPTFTNNFDNIKPTEIYKHFKADLVEKGYLTEQELNEYLKAAFELKTIPETLFKIKDAPNKAAIEAVFYKYYKNVAGKIHGKQNQYAALLGDYFEGYKTTTVSSNFSKSVY